MTEPYPTNDKRLTNEQIGQLENPDQLIHFFALLGYNVDQATPLNHIALGLDSADLRQQVQKIFLIGNDPLEGEITIYLMELRSVTVQLRQTIARRFRERPEDTLLILTSDYETLDFVLLEKERQQTKSLGKPYRLIVRPRTLTVNRRKPAVTARRVLQRFTVTEADSLYQWDKLKSAFSLAEWSEPYFNNRALFSDYYLQERLTDKKLTPTWGENVIPTARQVLNRLTHARRDLTGQPESVARRRLYEPLFESLGFRWQKVKAGSDDDPEKPDYLLFAASGSDTPIAAAVTTVWNRSLDNPDEMRDPETPEDIPGALVVSVLENDEMPNWVIMTNGKLWRLYAAQAANKATNYYEIDLEEAVNALDVQDVETAVKYWWLFFRQDAFTGFLDELLQASEDYAKGLRDRLKDRVFTQIFPHFAAGFIHDIRSEAGNPTAAFAEEALTWVYEGTLTFLYRLMFVLYAESLDLLPLTEVRGYREDSLYKLKREIAAVAGTVEDEAADKIRQAYGVDSTALYQRLQTLFSHIDTGSQALNLPTYNGGLFSQTNETGEFLADYAIPDQQLALGLDRLCRDVDEKSQALVFIDYKSLGVRQLGSIYEGLLEFKLRLDQSERLVQSDDVYLENDKRERKATGSYYTPDYIVKYIVAHTVGPVLARKFDELRPRLHAAQKKFRRHKELVAARGGDQPADLLWRNDEMRHLADDCLNVRVLDPAMGSGHFLVEVVDFVSNRLIDFLNAWSENPVWGMLDQIREEILADMARQSVTIDPARLTRVALLKRAVLKRCIYGVDLNSMAVELAKVSLWLDAFTLGAPLSFLDHHLKHGNSLIGARVAEVREALSAKPGEQMSLLAQSKFTGMMLATDLMQQVSYLSDNTVAQVTQSREAYRDARDHLAPYKRVLDVYTSRYFGNEPAKKGGFEPVIEFLKRDDTQAWIAGAAATTLPEKDYMNVRQVAYNAANAAYEKRFFHWELEFPEIFFAPSQPGGQDVQLRPDGGFDAVVGNPPYDELSEDALNREIDEREFLKEATIFNPTQGSGGRLNWYHYFMVLALQVSIPKGRNGLIVPMSWMGDSFTFGVRKWMLENHRPVLIEVFPQKDNPYQRVFIEAKLPTTIFIAEKNRREGSISVRVHPGKDILETPHFDADTDVVRSLTPDNLLIPLVDQNGWKILKMLVTSERVGRLGDIAAEPTSGEIIFNSSTRPFMSREQKPGYKLILRGSHVQRYEMVEEAKQGVPEYLNFEAYLENSRKDSKAYAFQSERIVYQEGSAIDAWRRIVPSYLPKDNVCGHKICYFVNYKIDQFTLLAVFASSLINWCVEKLSVTNSLPAYLISNLPFPHINFNTSPKKRKDLREQVVSAYEGGDQTKVMQTVQAVLTADQTDVVHDVLAHLAQVMIERNKEKQAEIKRFLGWLEGLLRIAPHKGKTGLDVFTGKTFIRNYLGDYQKGESPLPWAEFAYRLQQNRNRYAANLAEVKGQIQAEFEQSLAVLLPIKAQLAATDALIDKIVYQLYGLSDEEIALIEQPAYEQAFSEAKEKVRGDKKLQKDPDAALAAMAEAVRPAAERLQSRVNTAPEEARLDADLPGWRLFSGDVPTFLRTAEYAIEHLPDHLDFSASIVQYAKAVEQAMMQRLFEPFRAAGHTPDEAKNSFLKQFLQQKRHLTLGSFPIILNSKEQALAAFAERQYPRRSQALFFDKTAGVRALLLDEASLALRNAAAHSEALTKADARQARAWAFNILRYL